MQQMKEIQDEAVEFVFEWVIWMCFSPEQNSYQDGKTFLHNN